jgi:EAL domain-containing protein (putative c-di-GMP-specific phosphodiesterase class I)
MAANEWRQEMFLAVNISPGQLRDQWLPERILAVLTETGFSPARLEVEITENSLVEDIDVARAILYSLKNQGMRIALDDFGTGYSSLIHLRDLPLDKIKIDRSFVTSLKTDIGSAKIVSAILGLVTSLGLPTVAEGIESEDVAKILADLGCSYGQGYLYSAPLSAEEVEEMFAREEEAERRKSEKARMESVEQARFA